MDLTGKLQDSAFACYQYKVNAGDCQGRAYAVIEKFFGLPESELLYLQEFQSTEQFVEYLDYYNNRRIKAKRRACRLQFTDNKPFWLLEQFLL